MVYKSRWSIPIAHTTLPTFLFGDPSSPLPNKPCFIDADRPSKYLLTLASYKLWSQRLAAGLRRAGHQPRDRVLLFSGNTLFFPTVLLGVIMAEGIFTAANPGYNAREVAYQISDSGAKWVICAEGSLGTGLEAAGLARLGKERVFVFDDGYATFDGEGKGKAGCKHWTALLASEEEGRKFRWRDDESMIHDTICLNYSSGTTGLPKGVEITHLNYVSNTTQHMHLMTLRKDYAKKVGGYRWLCFLPMYHAMAQTIFCVGAAKYRIPVYVMQKYDFQQMLEHAQNFRLNELQLVPPLVIAMTKHPLMRQYDLSSVTAAGSGAAPLGAEITANFDKLWPPGIMNMKQGYGMTELTCSALGWDPSMHSDSFSVGEPNPNVEVRIVDPETLRDSPEGGRGEIWVRGPNVMKGYWKNEKATKETLTDDKWLRTGDIGRIDKQGHFFVVDRMKELIKVKGNQVAPAELEAQLLENKAIADAAVIGVTINGNELPRAYVVVAPGQNITPDAIAKYIETKVSRHKRLTGGVRIVDAIVKNPSGKILRKHYREQAAKELGDGGANASKL